MKIPVILTIGVLSFTGLFAQKPYKENKKPITDSLSSTTVNIEQFGGIGDGIFDNTEAFLKFNSWAKSKNPQLITLNFQKNKIYKHRNPYFTFNIMNLVVNGNGAILDNNTINKKDMRSLITAAGMGKQTGMGVQNVNVDDYLINSVPAGANYVVTKNIEDSKNIIAGEWLAITSMSITYGAYPPNFKYFEYRKVSSVDVLKGIIKLDRALKFSHSSDAINSVAYNSSTGKASIHRIEQGSKFGVNQVFNDLTLYCSTIQKPSHSDYTIATGLKITFKNCTFQNFDPSVAENITTINCKNLYTSEFDKLISAYTDNGSTWIGGISAGTSICKLTLNNSIVQDIVDMTPRTFIMNNITVKGNSKIGGRAGGIDTLIINGGNFKSMPSYSRTTTQTQTLKLGINSFYKSGVLTVPVGTIMQAKQSFGFLGRCDVGKKIDVSTSNVGLDKATGNIGIITRVSCDGINAKIYVTFNKKLTGTENLTIFNEPTYTKIKCFVNNLGKMINQSYFRIESQVHK